MRSIWLLLACVTVSGCDMRPWASGQNVWRGDCSVDEFDGSEECSVRTAVRHAPASPQTLIMITHDDEGLVGLSIAAPPGSTAISAEILIPGLYQANIRTCLQRFCMAENPATAIERMLMAETMRIRLRTEGREPIVADVNLIGLERTMLSDAPPVYRAYTQAKRLE